MIMHRTTVHYNRGWPVQASSVVLHSSELVMLVAFSACEPASFSACAGSRAVPHELWSSEIQLSVHTTFFLDQMFNQLSSFHDSIIWPRFEMRTTRDGLEGQIVYDCGLTREILTLLAPARIPFRCWPRVTPPSRPFTMRLNVSQA